MEAKGPCNLWEIFFCILAFWTFQVEMSIKALNPDKTSNKKVVKFVWWCSGGVASL